MKYPSILWSLTVLFLLFQSCVKDINIKPLPYADKISFESILMPGTLPKVYLSRAVPFFELNMMPSTAFIRNATVTISGEGVTDILKMDSTFDYFFCRWEPFYLGNFPTKENVTYTLDIETAGKVYAASTTTNIAAVQIDSVSYVTAFNDIYGEHEGVVVDFKDPSGQVNYYRYQMTRDIDSTITAVGASEHKSGCLGDSSATVIEIGRFVVSDKNQDGLPIRFVIEPAYKHKAGLVGYVRLQTLDKNAAEFFDQLDRQRQANANPFIEPVFLLSPYDGAIGLFGSMNLSEPVKFVFPE